MFRQMDKISSLLYEFYWSPEWHHIEHNEQWESYYYVSDIWNTIIEHIPPVLLVSKKFWFIKWLVENNKIDTDKIENKFYNEICITDYWDKNRAYWKSDLVISVLSISDTPIDDLLSYLR